MIPRLALVLAGLAALVLPLPAPDLLGGGLTLIGLLALGISAVRPGSTAPAVVIAAAAVSWLSTPDGDGHAARLAGLALALALVHASAALAAVVPARARVPLGLAARWAGWTAAATALGAGLMAGVSRFPASAGPVWPTVVAVLAVAALAALPLSRLGGGKPADV